MTMANVIPSSPPLPSPFDLPSPTSSEPPLFSSDDLLEADSTLYVSPRVKRKRVGPWWEGENCDSAPAIAKKSKLSRNFDSGVWLLSDDSEDARDCSRKKKEDMDPLEESLFQALTRAVADNERTYSLSRWQLEDRHLHHLRLLNQVIIPPPNPDTEPLHEGQFRTMVPTLFIDLASNNLTKFPRELLSVENVHDLSLRSNSIEEVPPGVAALSNLIKLNLSMTKVSCLPHEMLDYLFNKANQTELLLNGCPLILNIDIEEFTKLYVKAWDDLAAFIDNPDYTKAIYHLVVSLANTDRVRMREPVWLIKCLETWQANMKSSGEINFKRYPVHIGNSETSYYDKRGQLVAGSPAFPRSASDPHVITVHTSRFSFEVPPTTFRPEAADSSPPSLLASAFRKSLEFLTVAEIEEHLSGDTLLPQGIKDLTDKAKENEATIFSIWRKCAICKKEFIIPRTEWLEIWNYDGTSFLPVRAQGCSWACVP